MSGFLAMLTGKRASVRMLGNRARDAGEWMRAADHYRTHLQVHPADGAIWVQLGHMLTEAGDFDGADASYRRAQELDRGDADLLLCWGHSRKRAGDNARARELYAASVELDGNDNARRELAALVEQIESEHHETEDSHERSPDAPTEADEHYNHTASPPRRAWDARSVLVKPFAAAPGAELALFVSHSSTGALKPHVLPYLRALADQGIAVFLIAVTDRQLNIRPELIDAAAGVMVRENAGYDFAAWAHALHLYPELFGASTLYLVNDSVVPAAGGPALANLIARLRASDADLIGLTESHEYRWHYQSYFLALKPRLLSATRLHRFFDDVRILDDKDAVIQAYELHFTQAVEHSGHRLELLFPSPIALNPTLFDWRGLIGRGYPFMKLLPLRGAFPEADLEGWQSVLAQAGFDVALIEDAVSASEQQVPSDGDGQLYAHPVQLPPVDRLKVAFYGPWNYDNGLGAASRAMVAALRHTGVRLNLHPIKTPFHVHKPIAPAVDIAEFAGPADIAIVHLNPDCWFILTEEQREEVHRARKRIGYWVWEMGHLPDGWRRDFSSVDRIWTPSSYCASLFAAQDEAPVDVIPHPVPVSAPVPLDRERALLDLGLPRGSRVILYVFDGSSYLIRKNPAALVRAFAASGLAAEGWWLVLKTKHLMDRPEEGERFASLARSTDQVLLIDRAVSTAEMRPLWQLADIYASPHCSEGFGLTIAEAMAAGKPVLATDFGGSTDYLDATSGYPVKAREWTLTEDYGHYTKGGVWGRVDEPALTAALIRAARDVASGNDAIGKAAQARIADRLSYERVAALITVSLEQTMEGRGGRAAVDRIYPNLERGIRFADMPTGDNLVPVALADDGAIAGLPDDLPTDRDSWIAFAPTGAIAAPGFGQTVLDYARNRPDVAIFYADDVAAQADRAVDTLRLKPEFDATLLAAQDYVGAPVIIRASALAALGGLREETETAVMADLIFRAHAAGMSIARIPHVLIGHTGERVQATEPDYRRMLGQQAGLQAFEIVDGRAPNTRALVRRFDTDAPPVTLIIPTRRSRLRDGSGTYIERLLDGLAQTDWPMDRLRVIVGDDVGGDPSWAAKPWPFQLRHIETPRADGEPFNYAAKMNRLWALAETEQIVFLNDDIRLLDGAWLRALQTFAVDETVGGVGGRLLFDDGSLQHAGLGPHGDGAAHIWIFRTRHGGSYQGWAQTQREWSMVTGAVFATRRSLMDQIGGFDERFSLEYNDTDLCLRLRALGYRIVYNPLAEMVHTEKASRGDRLPPGEDTALFRLRWKPWLDADPAWHPQLRRDRLDMTPMPETDAWYL